MKPMIVTFWIAAVILWLFFSGICFAGYNREENFGGWIDEDNDGQNTREEVLERDSLIPVYKNESGKIIHGLWICSYTGLLFDDPKNLDIDHMVPLMEAYVSGAENWEQGYRIKYANYLNSKIHLVPVYNSSNREKSAKDISVWLPLVNIKEYVYNWYTIKERWNLCFDKNEIEVLKMYFIEAFNICGGLHNVPISEQKEEKSLKIENETKPD